MFYSPRRIDSDKKKHVTLPNNIFQSTFMFVSYRRRHYLLPRAAITAEIVVSDASMTSGTRRRPLETAREFFFSNEFPRGHYLVWWVRVRVKGPATRNDFVNDARADAIFATLKTIVDDGSSTISSTISLRVAGP